MIEVEFIEFDEKLLELSWTWLTDTETNFLTNTPHFTKEQQIEWFNSLPDRKDYLVWGVTVDEIPIGAAGLKRIIDGTAHVFWYIGEKKFQGKGVGTIIAQRITEISRNLGLKAILGEPIFENYRSINLLFKEGYKIVAVEKGFYLVRKDL